MIDHGAMGARRVGWTQVPDIAAVEINHPHAGAFPGVVDQDRPVVDEQHVVEVEAGAGDNPLRPGPGIDHGKRRRDGVAEAGMVVSVP